MGQESFEIEIECLREDANKLKASNDLSTSLLLKFLHFVLEVPAADFGVFECSHDLQIE